MDRHRFYRQMLPRSLFCWAHWGVVGFMLLLLPLWAKAEPATEATTSWLTPVRESPYWVSRGVYQNMATIRTWVLNGSGFCENPQRHVFYDRRGQFLGYVANAQTRQATQQLLNHTRLGYYQQGRADYWVPGTATEIGYPFALSCEQPHVDMQAAIGRYLGEDPDALIWGSWDDLALGSEQEPVSLHHALRAIHDIRSQQQRIQLPAELPLYLAGKLLIESGAQTRAHSAANARGIMQLSPEVLADCGISERNHWHRMAQMDCALRLLNQNARNLQAPFMARFGALPQPKRDRLFTLLLLQTYHGGAGRVIGLLADDELARPAVYFSRHHASYSAGDIAFGMVFHNLGRHRLGLASLYYIVDVEVAVTALCRQRSLVEDPLCSTGPHE